MFSRPEAVPASAAAAAATGNGPAGGRCRPQPARGSGRFSRATPGPGQTQGLGPHSGPRRPRGRVLVTSLRLPGRRGPPAGGLPRRVPAALAGQPGPPAAAARRPPRLGLTRGTRAGP